MNRNINFFILYVLPVILFGSFILYLSSQSKEVITSLSVVKQYKHIDKGEHLIEYGLFSLLIYRLFNHTLFRNNSIYLTVIFVALFALIDETLQISIPTREFSFVDIGFDIIGSFINILRKSS